MKYLKLITSIFFSAILFIAFSGNCPVNAGKENSPSVSGSPTTSVGDASFSCKIDGKDFSGKGTDEFGNAAYATESGIISYVRTN